VTYSGFLDATVLTPPLLRGTLLCIAQAEVYRALWCATVLDEVAAASERGDDIRNGLREWFPEAEVTAGTLVDHLAHGIEGDGSRIVASALVGAADVLVSSDWQRYEAAAGDQLTIQGPDEFLSLQLALEPAAVRAALEYQVSERQRHPTTVEGLLHELATVVPRFASAAAIEWHL
jgi:hypothetical protein